MAASAPTLPDVRAGIIEHLKGKTNCANRVGHTSGRAPSLPRILVEHAGSIGQFDAVIERARIVIHSFGSDPDQARYVAYQARDAILPVDRGPWGLDEIVSYEDPEDGSTRTVHLSGAFLESGPREAQDSRNRVITSYLVTYF